MNRSFSILSLLRWQRRSGLAFATLLLCLLPNIVMGRENLVSGSLTLRQEYDSNQDLTETDRRDAWLTTLLPGVEWSSRGPRDQWLLKYQAGLKKNHESGENKLDHDLLLQADKQFSSRWQAGLTNRFYHSDDPDYGGTAIEDVEEPISDRQTRGRFRTNNLGVNTTYQYGHDSNLGMGYNNVFLKSSGTDRDDFVRHNPYLDLAHQFNKNWRTEVGYAFIRGQFDESDDLKTHQGSLRLLLRATPHSQLFVDYTINETRYQGLSTDYLLHTGNTGTITDLGPHTTLEANVGLTAVERRGLDNLSTFSYAADLVHLLEQGRLSFGGQGGIDEMQFSSNGDSLVRYWQVEGSASRQLMQGVHADLALAVRHNKYIDRPTTELEKIYQSNLGLTYTFARWYQVSLRYLFKQLDGESDNDYDRHHIFLELRLNRDLFNW